MERERLPTGYDMDNYELKNLEPFDFLLDCTVDDRILVRDSCLSHQSLGSLLGPACGRREAPTIFNKQLF